MDCYFHNAVPSVAPCRDCARTVCATCRASDGSCPSCRLAARIDAASGTRERIGGNVGPSSSARGPRVEAQAEPQPQSQTRPQPQAAEYEPASATMTAPQGFWSYHPPVVTAEPPETRVLCALGYPFWPLAALALLMPRRGGWARRQALTALGFNAGCAALTLALGIIGHIELIGWSAWPLLAFMPFLWLTLAVTFAIKAGHGENVRVPIVSDWLDARDERAAGAVPGTTQTAI